MGQTQIAICMFTLLLLFHFLSYVAVIRYVAKIEKQVLVITRMFATACRTFVCRTCGRSSGDGVGQVVVCCSVGQMGIGQVGIGQVAASPFQ